MTKLRDDHSCFTMVVVLAVEPLCGCGSGVRTTL